MDITIALAFGARGIDLDKRVTAAIARALGAKSCLELGCFSGPVLSLLEQAGIEVKGVDASQLAFVLACPNVRGRVLFGDLLSLNIDKYDVVLAMDILARPRLRPARCRGI
jgi:2-polyprenyl-3-methyl-5-hydroxy-6-metoxy-1,4-benzoquinol methylase